MMTEIPPFKEKARDLTLHEYVIWLTTTSRDLTPQPRPVWFIWHEQTFLVFSRSDVHKVRHIRERPNVALHFNSDPKADENVVVFRGTARIDTDAPPAHEISAYVSKYRAEMKLLGQTPEEFSAEYNTAIRVDVGNFSNH